MVADAKNETTTDQPESEGLVTSKKAPESPARTVSESTPDSGWKPERRRSVQDTRARTQR